MPLVWVGWLARLTESIIPARVASRWGLVAGYDLWLSDLRNSRLPDSEQEEEEDHRTLIARLLFATSFLAGVACVLLVLLLLSAVGGPWGMAGAAVIALIGTLSVVTSITGAFTNYAISLAWKRHRVATDMVFVVVVIGCWLLFMISMIFT